MHLKNVTKIKKVILLNQRAQVFIKDTIESRIIKNDFIRGGSQQKVKKSEGRMVIRSKGQIAET